MKYGKKSIRERAIIGFDHGLPCRLENMALGPQLGQKPRPSASVFVYWVPRAMFFTRHGRPWSNPTTYHNVQWCNSFNGLIQYTVRHLFVISHTFDAHTITVHPFRIYIRQTNVWCFTKSALSFCISHNQYLNWTNIISMTRAECHIKHAPINQIHSHLFTLAEWIPWTMQWLHGQWAGKTIDCLNTGVV